MSKPWNGHSHQEVPHEVLVLADRLHSAAIHLLRRVRREDEGSGVTAARLSALSVVVFGGPLSLGELAAAEQVRPATMSRTVAALEEAGLVRRDVDPEDGRSILVQATEAGEQLLDEARLRRVESLAADLAELDPEETGALRLALDGLARALDLPTRRPPGNERDATGGRGE